MRYLKNSFFTCLLLFVILSTTYSQQVYPDPHYRFLSGPGLLQDRNFYLFTLLEQLPGLPSLLTKDSSLNELAKGYKQRIANPVSKHDMADSLLFTENTIRQVSNTFITLLERNPEQWLPLLREMRGSGLFELYAGKSDAQLLHYAWKDAANGINYIINAYANGTGLRYPVIDSAAFYVRSPAYRAAIQQLLEQVREKDKPGELFFQPSLQLALGLLRLNHRDEAVRYEPMSATNGDAYRLIKKTSWDKYPYPAMLILGASPVAKETISETGKSRCRMGAELYRKGLAPFIIVSGGHVRPVGTVYSEAIEMKKYLVNELKIPAAAVMVDPYARHTTTNVRNAVRIAWRSGIPVNKRMLCVSDAMHLVYVNSPLFKQRCMTELGYMPAADIKQADLYFLSFLPDLRSLQANAFDPLDP
ncbi:YdcF family protein [Chitinophaga sp. 22321]|uniref:YdcF family protein n=1 Tax=Chitinophaga hostae TaxID=2831022 RepID=A0ABS5J4I6_9BACT|nr:YdcF family protein [Chitinophaga hostae]MBS0030143.1 YdcF family protein [Chitinophaga hostae]